MIQVTPKTSCIGAEITGVDLNDDLDNETFDAIVQAYHDHIVLVFPDQDLSPQAQSRFSQRFGPVEPHPNGARVGIEEAPEVIILENKPELRGARNDFWHSDISSAERPPSASFLHAKIIPQGRGDTLFCNMYRAYEDLSDGLRRTLLSLNALHSSEAIRQRNLAEPDTDSPEITNVAPPMSHPVVRTHPETGRQALYVNAFFTMSFDDMTPEESRPMLDYLVDRATRPELIYRHSWRVGDLVMWDNRACMHYAVRDYDQTMPRRMHRTTAGGDRPFLRV